MKQIYLLLLAITFFSCDKKYTEPEPALSEQVKGKYQVYEVIFEGKVQAVAPNETVEIIELIPRTPFTAAFESNIGKILSPGPIYDVFQLKKKDDAVELINSKGQYFSGLVYNDKLELYSTNSEGFITIKRSKKVDR